MDLSRNRTFDALGLPCLPSGAAAWVLHAACLSVGLPLEAAALPLPPQAVTLEVPMMRRSSRLAVVPFLWI